MTQPACTAHKIAGTRRQREVWAILIQISPVLFLWVPAKHRNTKIILAFCNSDLDSSRKVTFKLYCEPTIRIFSAVFPQLAVFNLSLLLELRSWVALSHLLLCWGGIFIIIFFKIQPYSFKTTAFHKQAESATYLDIQIPFPKLVCCGLRHSLLSEVMYCQHGY